MSWWLWLITGFGVIVGAIVIGFVILASIGFWQFCKSIEDD